MAYGVRFRTILHPPNVANPIYVDILKNNYVGAITNIKVAAGGVTLTVDDNDYFENLISTSIEIKIINTLTNFFENLHDWDDLFLLADFEIMFKVYDTNVVYFEGFMPCDISEQEFFPKGIITLNASNNLKRLSDFYPTMFTVSGQYLMIDIIKHCLSFTGLNLPIYVNCSIFGYEPYIGDIFASVYTPTYNYSTVTRTAFDWVSIESDIFKKDDISFEDCRYILENILATFNCKLYYWNSRWYIERVKDLGHTTKHYVVYNTNGTTTTSNLTNTHLQIAGDAFGIGNDRSKLTFMELSQVVSYNPGVKRITLNLNEKQKLNLGNYYFTGVRTSFYYTGGTYPYDKPAETILPEENIWVVIRNITPASLTQQSNYYDIINGLTINATGGSNSIAPLDSIANWRVSLNGLYTQIKLNLNTKNTTSLTIKVKFKLPDAVIASYGATIRANPDKMFYVRVVIRSTYNDKFAKYNATTQLYELVTRGSNDASNSIITPNGSTIDPCIITQGIAYSDFTNKEAYETEVDVNVPISDFYAGDTYIIGICQIGYNYVTYGESTTYNAYFREMTFGDIIFSVNEDDTDNTMTGEINDAFVNLVTQDLLFYDANYQGTYFKRNILNQLYGVGHMGWMDAFYVPIPWDHTIPKAIQTKIIEDQYQIFNKVRRFITSDIYCTAPIKPFSLADSWYFSNPFMLSSYQWIIDSNQYSSLVLKEFVDDDDVS